MIAAARADFRRARRRARQTWRSACARLNVFLVRAKTRRSLGAHRRLSGQGRRLRGLRKLADVDDARDAETALARMDPDIATLIRRLRDLPDPPPIPPKRKTKRRRQPASWGAPIGLRAIAAWPRPQTRDRRFPKRAISRLLQENMGRTGFTVFLTNDNFCLAFESAGARLYSSGRLGLIGLVSCKVRG